MKKRVGATTFSGFLIKALLEFASHRGADAGAVLHRVLGDNTLCIDERTRYPVHAFNHLWKGIAEDLEDEFLGLHFGEYFGTRGEGHFLVTLMKNSESLERAIDSLIRYHGLMTDVTRPRLSLEGERAVITWETEPAGAPVPRHLAEAAMALLATVLRAITHDEVRLLEVCFAHACPGESGEYLRIFGVPPLFDSVASRLVFDAVLLYRPMPMAHGEFASYLRHYAEVQDHRYHESASWRERVTFRLKRAILGGEPSSISNVSIAFHTSVRSLQLKLREEGTTFQALLVEVKREIALHYLRQGDVLLCDIAFLLGFSEQSSFNHAFRRWTGMTPREFRERHAR